MNNILSFWNKNRRGIIIAVVVIVFLITVVQLLEQNAKREVEREANVVKLTEEEKKLPTESRIGGKTVSLTETKNNVSLINEFVDKCNNGDVSGAYSMLTTDCKETKFPTIEKFKTLYYDKLFTEKRLIEIENYLSSDNRYIYLVKFYENVLSKGTVDNIENRQDYITIDENFTEGKLSIDSLIYKKDINKVVEKDGIRVTVVSQEVYKDNEKFEVTIENNTNKRILLDTRKKVKSIYALGSNSAMYTSNISEISSTLLEIPAKMKRTYNLKFSKLYSSGTKFKNITFTDIVSDLELYNQSKDNVKERVEISVSI